MSALLLDPRLADCRRIFLRNYVLDANIGVHAHEKNGAQSIALNVDVFVPLALSTPRHDRIHEVVDYDFIRRTVAERSDQPQAVAGLAAAARWNMRPCTADCGQPEYARRARLNGRSRTEKEFKSRA